MIISIRRGTFLKCQIHCFSINFDVFSLLEIRKRKRRSHGKRQKGNDKRKRCAAQKSGTSLNNLT